MKKRIISLLLAASITITPAMAFSDTDGHWAESSITAAADAGVISGYGDGSFLPNANITRAEFAAMLCRLFGWQDRAENTYADLPAGAWYEDILLRADAAGVMRGSEGLIRPNDLITRQEAAVCIARALKLWQTAARVDYADFDDIADWAKAEVSALTRFGFISGRGDGRFAPKENLTRAEAATLIAVLLHAGEDGKDAVEQSAEPEPQPGPQPPIDALPEEPENYILFRGEYYEILPDVPKSSKAASDFSVDERGRITYPGARTGIDVSAWQGEIDWEAVAADGVDFAIIRAGFRGYTVGNLNVDSCFAKNIAGAKAAGLEVGVYFYSQAVTAKEAAEEARLVLDLLDGQSLDLPVVYDWELPASKTARTRGISRADLTACAKAFCETIEAAGYQPMVYFYLSLGYTEYRIDEFCRYPFWLAQYSDRPTFYYDYNIWQYTDKGVVKGIEGGVDMNLMFK